LASDTKNTPKSEKKGYQPKATARHAKITKTRKEDIEALKAKIATDKYLAKKYESNRKTEIKSMPKDDRAVAKAELKESIVKRKESERKDKERLQTMIHEERTEKGKVEKESFDEETWLKGGRKKSKDKNEKAKKDVPAKSEEPIAEPAPADEEEQEDKDQPSA
jgi:hypothetical protein